MKKKSVVIAGSAKIQDEIEKWLEYFKNNNYELLDWPKNIDANEFMQIYPQVFKEFFESIQRADMFFLLNEDKNGITGYIGAESFAELVFAVTQKILYGKQLEVVIRKMPDKRVACFDEVDMWIKLGYVKIFNT